jgi:Mn-dependent DtxR family transcriptional regulator
MVAKAIADGLIEREPDGGFKITEAGHEYTRALTRARTRTRTLLESKS